MKTHQPPFRRWLLWQRHKHTLHRSVVVIGLRDALLSLFLKLQHSFLLLLKNVRSLSDRNMLE